MNPKQPQRMNESQQEQIDALSAQVAHTRTDVSALEAGADKATERASTSEHLASTESRRTDQLVERADVQDALIATLQADGLLNKDQAAHLDQALRSSRVIGAAIGITMLQRNVSDVEAFKTLDRASQNTNCKLRVIAQEVVRTRGVHALRGAAALLIDAR